MLSRLLKNIPMVKTCPECEGGTIRQPSGEPEAFCEQCGFIPEDGPDVDYGPEWRSFDEEDRQVRRRTGPVTNRTHLNRGHYTTFNVNEARSEQRARFSRMRTKQRWAESSEYKRAQHTAYGEMRRMCSALGLPKSIAEQAHSLFDTVYNDLEMTGRTIEAVVSACIYTTCRINTYPRTFEEVGEVCRVGAEKTKHMFKVINREMRLPLAPPTPLAYVDRFGSEADLDEGERRTARNILKSIPQKEWASKNPAGFAAAAVYMSALRSKKDDHLTQSESAEVGGVSTVTIRTQMRKMREYVGSADPADENPPIEVPIDPA